jgi:predicted RND superfamily exporter protein
MQELILIISLAGFVAVFLIVLMTRSFRASIGIVITVAGALVIVFGIKGYMHEMVDSAFMLVPILLTIAVSVAYSIHFTSFYDKTLQETGDREKAVIYSMKKNGWPIFFAAFTTVVALSSFLFVPITTIKWAGTTAALSIFVVFVLLMFFYPAVLSIGNVKVDVKKKSDSNFWDRNLLRLSDYVVSHGKLITIVFIIVFIIMTAFSSLIEVNLHPKKMFGTKMPHAKEMVYVSESPIATNYSYNVLLKGNEDGFFKKLKNAEKLVELEEEIDKSKTTNSVAGFSNKAREMYQALKGDKPEYNRLPSKESTYKSIVKRLEKHTGKQMRAWMTEDYSTTQIFVSLPDFESKSFIVHVDSIKDKIAELYPEKDYPNFTSNLTGYAIQFSKMNQYITIGLIRSFGISLILIFILMSIAFNSAKLGAIAIVPNIAPVIIAGGIMGIFNLPLEFVTMTIAPMILGLAVDNTIHFINGTHLEFLKTRNYDLAIKNTYQTVGQAIVKSTIILCFTLLSFTVSDMNNMVNMGTLTVIAIFSATITDFMVTPTIIRLIKPFGKED